MTSPPTRKTIKRLASRLYARLIWTAAALKLPGTRTLYWEMRAKDIDEEWGTATHDYPIITQLLSDIQPIRLLDVGCGSGRFFPLYAQARIQEVIGQDISRHALQIAAQRHPYPNIRTVQCPIERLDYPRRYFDLIISNRAIQSIPPQNIDAVIKKLTELGNYMYLNEMTDSDDVGDIFYLFKHDYPALFAKYHYHVLRQGMHEKQTWQLFGAQPEGAA